MNQYYRVHAVIDLDAICHNIREVKRVVGEGVKVMPVIKADGYICRCNPRRRDHTSKQWNQTANLDFRIHIRISVQLIDSV